MTTNQKVLKSYHVIFLVQSIMFSTGVLSLPQRLSSMGYSQIWVPILFGVITSLLLWPMMWIGTKYQDKNLFYINEDLLGKWVGKFINILIVLHFIIFATAITSHYMELIETTALQEQTITIPLILFLLLIVYLVNGGIKNIARFCILAFFLTIPMVYFLRWSIAEGDVSHFFPLFNFTSGQFFKAMDQGYYVVLGYELLLIYFPYIINQKKAYRDGLIGVWISVSLYFLTVIVSVMYFSEWQLKNIEFSVLHLFKATEFSFAERIDIVGITLWIFLVLTTVGGYAWAAKKGIGSIVPKYRNYFIYIITLIIFGIVTSPYSHEYLERIFIISYRFGYFLLIWPLLLIIVFNLRKKGRR